MTIDDYVFRPYESGDDDHIVSILRRCLDDWHDKDTDWWRWATVRRPGFTPADVIVVQNGEDIVGCFHGAVHPVRFDSDVEVLASVDTGFAVVPEHRARGLPDRAHAIMDEDLVERGAALRGGYPAVEGLNLRFYRPRYGYQIIPVDTVVYRKALGIGALRRYAPRLAERIPAQGRAGALLAARPVTVDLKIDLLPDCHIVVGPGEVEVRDGTSPAPSVRLQVPYRLLMLSAYHPLRGVGVALWALLRRRLRIRGLVRRAPFLLSLAVLAAMDRRADRVRREQA